MTGIVYPHVFGNESGSVPASQLDDNFDAVQTYLDTSIQAGVARLCLMAGTTQSWILLSPAGDVVSTAGTTTSGLQEAINYCAAQGLSLDVIGGATSRTADFGLMPCTSGVGVPPIRSMSLRLIGVHVAFSAAVTGDGIVFDSFQECNIDLSAGEVTYSGNTTPVRIKPRTALPVDTTIGCNASTFRMCAIANENAMATPVACVTMDISLGTIQGVEFIFNELNGAGAVGSAALAQFGVVVTGATVSTAFQYNDICLPFVHNTTAACVQAGVTTANQANIHGNTWRIGKMEPHGAASDGFNSFASGDTIIYGSVIGSPIQSGYNFQPGANGNTMIGGTIQGGRIDGGTNNTVITNGAIYRGGVPFPGNSVTTVNSNTGTTISAAAIAGGIVLRTGAAGGGFSDTTDTATAILALLPGAVVGSSFRFRVQNTAAQTQTLLAGSGVTVTGLATTANNASHDFIGLVTATGTPAITIYG